MLTNVRFYILVVATLLSVVTYLLFSETQGSASAALMRTQQIYGFFGLTLWYIALVISPLGYMVGKDKIKGLIFARRAIGVSAAYFVILHAAISTFTQLGGVGGILMLSDFYRYSLLAGFVAMVILIIMASTSFDAVIKRMSFKRWKLLHRLSYIGGVLAILHIWAIGTHSSTTLVQITAFIALLTLTGLESFRIAKNLSLKFTDLSDKSSFIAVLVCVWTIFIVGILAIPQLIDNYHNKHINHSIYIIRGNA